MTRPTLFIAVAGTIAIAGVLAWSRFSAPLPKEAAPEEPVESAPVVRSDSQPRWPEPGSPRPPHRPVMPAFGQPVAAPGPGQAAEAVEAPPLAVDGAVPNVAQFVPKGLESQQAVVLESRDLVNAGRVDEAITVLLRAADAAPRPERDRLILLGARIRMGQNQADQARQLLSRVGSGDPDVQQGVERVRGQIERARQAGVPSR